ncbi:TRAP transporter substrate-binding protein [Thalassotalea aquiviva]|uniref:TRAP transporter substrate-binding protein n=1 Tax=Thalassotalea aquiviva TaxID=3242415 RepID=UPI00352B64B5
MIKTIKIMSFLAFASLLSACSDNKQTTNPASEQQHFEWNLVTSWPKNFPGLGRTPEIFANYVKEMSNGRLIIKVYGAGELVPGFEVFDAVQSGSAQMGHSAAYYWKGKMAASSFFTAVPFGMNAQETNAWLHYGGGLELWQQLYKPFGIMPLAGGNTGMQFAGWFNKEVNSLADLQGLKMRIGGIGGEVFQQAGGLPVNMPGGEIFSSLQSGALDGAEWVGPYNDLAFGFHQAAKYYYASGWHEPSATLEFLINQQAFDQLPADLQAIVKIAARAAHTDTLDVYAAKNSEDYKRMLEKYDVQVKNFPPEVMSEFKQITKEVINQMIIDDNSNTVAKIWQSYQGFYDTIRSYHEISEQAYLENR